LSVLQIYDSELVWMCSSDRGTTTRAGAWSLEPKRTEPKRPQRGMRRRRPIHDWSARADAAAVL